MALLAGAILYPPGGRAEGPGFGTQYNTYGSPGLIDMPVAEGREDADLAFTTSHFAGQTRNTLTFQITPRLSGSFRYSRIEDFRGGSELFDRSFALQYQLLTETERRPSVAIGLNDFIGTGIYSSEYVVASKALGNRVRVTGGIGWGRLAGVNGFRNPLGIFDERFETRPERDIGMGGKIESAGWFRGDAALFGGIEFQATDRLRLLAEYSSDAYPDEDPFAFERASPLNFGLRYQLGENAVLGLNYLYGSELGAQVTLVTNPRTTGLGSGYGAAPPSVVPRPAASAEDLGWAGGDAVTASRARVARALAAQGLELHAFRLTEREVRVEIENETYPSTAEAIGRTARSLTGVLPPSVENFEIVPLTNGLAGSAVTIRRSDLEELEFAHDNARKSLSRARFEPARRSPAPLPDLYPRFDWNLDPYLSPSFFDPDAPLRADVGLQLSASYEPLPGLVFAGRVRKKAIGNLDEATRTSNSILPRVRSDFAIYDREGDPSLEELAVSYFFQPGPETYGRLSLGYLEPMFGGLSGEMLWKRSDSPFAYGVELNYVRQRDFDKRLGFRDYEVATGHASLYWDLGNGFHAQLDAGRYLAGDWGATLSIDREFGNGWRVGAFATLTDVPFDDFGEGSFDKGLRFTVPLTWLTGEPDRRDFTTTIRPVQRDGGARLAVSNRLYHLIRERDESELRDDWGRFWR